MADSLGFDKLGSTNYGHWATDFKAFITIKVLDDAVCGTAGAVDADKDKVAMAWLTRAVLPMHYGTLTRAGTARAAWQALRDVHVKECKARQLALLQALNDLCKLSSETVTVYVGRAMDLRDGLQAAGHDISDQELVLRLMSGLKHLREYDTIVTVMMSKDELTLSDLQAKLLIEEARVTATAGVDAQMERAFYSAGSNSHRFALGYGFNRFAPGQGNRFGSRQGRGRAGSGFVPTCYYCKEVGHFKGDCPKLKAKERAEREGARGGDHGNPRSGGRGGEGYGRTYAMAAIPINLRNPVKDRVPSFVNTWRGAEWVVDTGAGHHITGELTSLINRRPADVTVTFANGEARKVIVKGDVLIVLKDGDRITLSDVLYVEGAAANLLSVPCATRKGSEFFFSSDWTGDYCVIKHRGKDVAAAYKGAHGVFCIRNHNKVSGLEPHSGQTREEWHKDMLFSTVDWDAKMAELAYATADKAGAGEQAPVLLTALHGEVAAGEQAPEVAAGEQAPVLLTTSDGAAAAGEQAVQVAAGELAAEAGTRAQLWHRRYGHLGYGNMSRLVTEDMVAGLPVPAKEFEVSKKTTCEPCIFAKSHRLPFPTAGEAVDATAPMQLIHMDRCGPLPEPTLGDKRYVATFLDDFSKLSEVRLISHKANVPDVVQDVITLMENQSGHKCKSVRTDNGKEYVNARLSAFFRDKGIVHQKSAAYTPEQNGAAERINRTLMERARAMLADADLPADLWGKAVLTANHIRCRSPAANKPRTPWELFYGVKPDVSHLRVFGATAYMHVPKEKRNKLDQRAERGIMVGYPDGVKGYCIMLPDGRIMVSRDVHFDESVGTARRDRCQQSPPPDVHVQVTAVPGVLPAMLPAVPAPDDVIAPNVAVLGDDAPAAADPEPEAPAAAAPAGDVQPDIGAPVADAPAPRYPARDRRPPGEWFKQTGAHAALVVVAPTTVEEAMASEQAEQWRDAMNDEMASLNLNQTWELEQPPEYARVIPVKWVFAVKTNADGDVERFKARLVAKGYVQREGIDFQEIFAPVGMYATLRMLLAKAAALDLEVHQMDIKTAFLNGTIDEDLYVQQPPGYVQGDGSLACRLKRALYGLRQAPRQWHAALKEKLESCGFEASQGDPGLFVYNSKSNAIYLHVYVDDILIVSKDLALVQWAKDCIKDAFDARDLGEAKLYLGMTIERDRQARTLKLGQERLTAQLLETYRMMDAKPASVPLTAGTTLVKDEGKLLDQAKFPFCHVVGSLMHLTNCTRPDIAFTVGSLAKFMQQPTTAHWNAAMGVLRYLRSTKDHGVCFGGNRDEREFVGYCDADYAGDLDTRRSTTAYVFIYNGGAVSWSSRRQQTVAVSTTEAEYMAASAAVREALWLKKLLGDLDIVNVNNPIMIMSDNQGAIKLLHNPITSVRSKHIDVIYHFARERIARKEVAIEYVRTDHMLADVLTKALPKVKHAFCCAGMGVSKAVMGVSNAAVI